MGKMVGNSMSKELIPRVLHYIWLGGKPLPKQLQTNVDNWQRLMPDYRLVRWDEGNYDVGAHPWAAQMHREGRFAFVSDLVRLDVLHQHGGVYLDVDMELYKPLDAFLGERLLLSFQFDSFLSTGIIGSCKGNPFLQEWMLRYDQLGGAQVSNDVVTRLFLERFPKFRLNNRDQRVDNGGIRVLPKEYFILPTWNKEIDYGVDQSFNSWKQPHGRPYGKYVRAVIGNVLFYKLINMRMNWRSEYLAMDKARRRAAAK